MKKTVVVYSSKYGSTKQYAEWIAQELCCDLFDKKEISEKELEAYEIIIYGGGLYAGGLNGISIITKAYDRIKEKKIVVFTCGLADPEDQSNIQGIQDGLRKCFTAEMQNKIQIYHLRGAMDYNKLSTGHKIMMGMLHKAVSKKDKNSLTNENKEFLETYGKSVDFKDKNKISSLISYVREC